MGEPGKADPEINPIRESVTAGQGPGTAAGPADVTESRQFQRIGKLLDIGRVIEQLAPWLEIGVADTGAVGGQDAKPVLPGFFIKEAAFQTAARHAVPKDNRVAEGVANVRERQGPAI